MFPGVVDSHATQEPSIAYLEKDTWRDKDSVEPLVINHFGGVDCLCFCCEGTCTEFLTHGRMFYAFELCVLGL